MHREPEVRVLSNSCSSPNQSSRSVALAKRITALGTRMIFALVWHLFSGPFFKGKGEGGCTQASFGREATKLGNHTPSHILFIKADSSLFWKSLEKKEGLNITSHAVRKIELTWSTSQAARYVAKRAVSTPMAISANIKLTAWC